MITSSSWSCSARTWASTSHRTSTGGTRPSCRRPPNGSRCGGSGSRTPSTPSGALSKTPWPKASNGRVLQPYSPSMRDLLAKGSRTTKRPSGHKISEHFGVDNGAAIPPNLLAIPNTESNSFYLRYCEQRGLKPHACPESGRVAGVLRPHAHRTRRHGDRSVCRKLRHRRGLSSASAAAGSVSSFWRTTAKPHYGRFGRDPQAAVKAAADPKDPSNYYRVLRPGILWNGADAGPLPEDGGRQRQARSGADKRPTATKLDAHPFTPRTRRRRVG